MNGIDFLADTNALIYLLDGNSCMKQFLSNQLGASIITEIELKSFPLISKEKEQYIQSMLNECIIISLDKNIKNTTIYLRRSYKIKLPDAIIAATALAYKLPLISADKGLKKISELNLVLIEPNYI